MLTRNSHQESLGHNLTQVVRHITKKMTNFARTSL